MRSLIESNRSSEEIIQDLTEGYTKFSGRVVLEPGDTILYDGATLRELVVAEKFKRGKAIKTRGIPSEVPRSLISKVKFKKENQWIPVIPGIKEGLFIAEEELV